MKNKKNPHIGSSFEDFLKEDGIYEEVTAVAVKRSLALELEKTMKAQKITKVEMSRRMETSRSQLDRLLDPENDKVQLDTLYKAASAVGKNLKLELV
ncbi:MAG: XRE family transcriptional regulator [Deltaproteobacteria bacterium]|nr:XRE family transcriptional regulator [Deltaproteobacteria bacterium]